MEIIHSWAPFYWLYELLTLNFFFCWIFYFIIVFLIFIYRYVFISDCKNFHFAFLSEFYVVRAVRRKFCCCCFLSALKVVFLKVYIHLFTFHRIQSSDFQFLQILHVSGDVIYHVNSTRKYHEIVIIFHSSHFSVLF